MMSRLHFNLFLFGMLSLSTCAWGFPEIANSSFEANTWNNPHGSGPINSWQANAGMGINPAGNGNSTFADNGKIPHGNYVAYLQGGLPGSPVFLSQSIKGFRAGRTYYVLFNVNARAYWGLRNGSRDEAPLLGDLLTPTASPQPTVSVTLGGKVIEPGFTVIPVEKQGSYTILYHERKTAAFVAEVDGEYTLVLSSQASPGYPDVAALFDNIRIIQDPPDPNTPPMVAPLPEQIAYVGSRLTFNVLATDTNEPPQKLKYQIKEPVPKGASIDEEGKFEWVPGEDHLGANHLDLLVIDDGSPALTNTVSAVVHVQNGPLLSLHYLPETAELIWNANPGEYYEVFYKDDLLQDEWMSLGLHVNSEGGEIRVLDPVQGRSRFYRVSIPRTQ